MFDRQITIIKSDSFFLFGARGTGKTTLLKGDFDPGSTLWINLLDPVEEDLFVRNPGELATRIAAQPHIDWVVIDEVQKAPKLLNLVHDLIENKGIKFALTGSSARRLKQKGVNLLAGRAFTNHLFPLTHVELGDRFDLDEVLAYGSLPKIYTDQSPVVRAEYLRSYGLNYVQSEIQAEQWVRKLEPFRKFLPVAAQMNGKLINYSKIAREVGVDVTTVMGYFEILEDTLLGFRLDAYDTSVRKRQFQAPKFFFFDLGVKRALDRTLNVALNHGTYAFGSAFEHFIICEMIRLSAYRRNDFSFSHLRTKDGAEIDVVIERPGQPVSLVEIKAGEQAGRDDVRTLKAFARDITGAETFVLSRDPHAKVIDGVRCLPWQEGFRQLGLVDP
jgi:predicted AAA+ superfamily ATPase